MKNFLSCIIKKRSSILKSLEDLNGIGDTQVKSINDFFSNKKIQK